MKSGKNLEKGGARWHPIYRVSGKFCNLYYFFTAIKLMTFKSIWMTNIFHAQSSEPTLIFIRLLDTFFSFVLFFIFSIFCACPKKLCTETTSWFAQSLVWVQKIFTPSLCEYMGMMLQTTPQLLAGGKPSLKAGSPFVMKNALVGQKMPRLMVFYSHRWKERNTCRSEGFRVLQGSLNPQFMNIYIHWDGEMFMSNMYPTLCQIHRKRPGYSVQGTSLRGLHSIPTEIW